MDDSVDGLRDADERGPWRMADAGQQERRVRWRSPMDELGDDDPARRTRARGQQPHRGTNQAGHRVGRAPCQARAAGQ
jgi:hypothetical protein